jgi:molecular chaperone DnaK
MMKESEQFAEQDKKRREEAEIRNNADSLIYTAEKTKKDLADKLGKEQVERIDKAVAELREILSSKDVAKIKAKNEELAKVLQEVGTVVYQQAAAKRAEQGKPEKTEGPKEKVVDADYEEEKKD